MRRIWRAPAIAMLLLATASVAHAQIEGPDKSYVLGVDDQLDVSIHGDRQSSGAIRVRIRPDGMISLPLVGDVSASGLTTAALSARIQSVLANRKLLVQPIVNVEVASYVSRSATLLGAVVRPGVYPLYAPQRLSTILALAGGNRESSDIIILRREGKPELRVTVEEVASGGDKDPFIDGGDLIFVPEPDRFYVYGQVRQPGGYAVRPGMTIRQALAQGGGPTEAGTEDNLRLFRNGQRMAAEQLDTPIQDGDVVFVRERVF